eukprot:SAG31_NODE_15018_length_775_cov_1.071006_2_plen_164_part_01
MCAHCHCIAKHAAVDETHHFLRACCVHPPTGIEKSYLTPMSLLTSANAFKDALNAVSQESALTSRVERASMAVKYVALWRWTELQTFASNISYSWPLASTQQAAFDDFAHIYNATGTRMLASAMKGVGALDMLHACVFGDKSNCPVSNGGGDGGAVYAEVGLDD